MNHQLLMSTCLAAFFCSACGATNHPYEDPEAVLEEFKDQHASAKAGSGNTELVASTNYVPFGRRSTFALYATYENAERQRVGELKATVDVLDKADSKGGWTILETVAEQWQKDLQVPAAPGLPQAVTAHKPGRFIPADSTGLYEVTRQALPKGETLRLTWRTAAFVRQHPQ
ncbi:hypothetical protein LJ737_19985 [Hymenobacter sp. 15J16-1T3B]|uniref:hypothetical protein n=1 Tax=Hymenobacter sp. 15J16-1T3B TaxID=2886941 RepID=UPI001D118447|nr:hypothetical protein [Hymenobacter sp. 15J16-1T3B]MCC3159533.1 hypothetical protein [Hymenobacter sp. 15J16-1T3B]